MIRQFQYLLNSIVVNPASRLSELPVESATEDFNRDTGTSGLSTSEPREDSLPGSSIEKKLASIWSEVLSVQQIASNDNLFDLGGHSLLITRIISRIRNFFQIDVPIHAFFETPTVAAIAALIQSEMETRKTTGLAMNRVIRRRGSLQAV
jgi:acyl carrier protein